MNNIDPSREENGLADIIREKTIDSIGLIAASHIIDSVLSRNDKEPAETSEYEGFVRTNIRPLPSKSAAGFWGGGSMYPVVDTPFEPRPV